MTYPQKCTVLPATQGASPGQMNFSRVAATRPPDKEFIYKKTPQGELGMFVYLPPDWKKTDQRPAILFFHGGGWTSGTPEQFFSKSEYLASRGMVAFNVGHRLKNTHRTGVKECVEDARSAMRFVRKNAAAWGVDPAKLIASGGSSGGHLAACAAVLEGPDDAADDPAVSCKPQALVLFNPVLDCIAMLDHEPKRDWYLSLVSGNSQEQRTRALAELSPFAQLRTACPPTNVFYGTEDKLLAAGRAFARKSANLGGKIKVWEAPGVGHGFFNATPWHEVTLIKMDQFLASLGFLKGQPKIQPADAAALLG